MSERDDVSALKPCPFCGNTGSGPIEHALHVVHSEHDWRGASYSVQCDQCTATMGYRDSKEDAVEDWNLRAARPDPAADKLAEALRDGWNACRRSIYAVCEDVDREADQASKLDGDHARGYAAGMARAAKSIARGFSAMEAEDDDHIRAALGGASDTAPTPVVEVDADVIAEALLDRSFVPHPRHSEKGLIVRGIRDALAAYEQARADAIRNSEVR